MSDRSSKSAIQRLATPVQYLKGVGSRRAERLRRLNVNTASDLLFFFPRGYEEMSQRRTIRELEQGRPATVLGVIEEVELRRTGPGRSLLAALVRQDNDYLRALWFNQPFMQQRLAEGQHVLLSGSPRLYGGRWEMTHPNLELLGAEESPPAGRIFPVYPLTEGIQQTQMRRIVHAAAATYAGEVDEVLPPTLLDSRKLWPIRKAIQQIHTPNDATCLEQARRRFIYEELLVLQLALALRRWSRTGRRRAPPLPATAKIDARILRLFPFELTADQLQAIREISEDMGRSHPMNRLLQGEVGSGKTVVAQYAMLLAAAHERQAALMAPTEVLARQHARTFQQSLRNSRLRIGLLTGGLAAAERKQTLADIAAGKIDLIIGTHAVVQSAAEFAQLGLVVIDEQHKFGVQQRAALKHAGPDPHYLVMTATPIPRTVSMTLFGDLDVSTLRTSPPGRQNVYTYLGSSEKRERWWDFFRRKLREGRQGYVITPLVDPFEAVELASVESAYEELANGELELFRLDLIHGRMSAAEKDQAMEAFRCGHTQVLVATSVIEVGVDVPNATVMTVEGGQRFGLAQLHQLRGRISRGVHPGYLCVFADPKNEDAARRLEAFIQSRDGFELAELDLKIRGPGDLFSQRQHGLPPLRIADVARDAQLLEQARRDAQAATSADPDLKDPAFARLRRMVLARYGQVLELGDVG